LSDNSQGTWLINLFVVLLCFVAAGAVGVYVDEFWLCIALVALILLGLQCWQMLALHTWLSHYKKLSYPHNVSAWGLLYKDIYAELQKGRTKRKQLAESLRTFKRGSEALPDATVVVNQHHEVLWCNRLARIELGVTWPEKTGLKITDIVRSNEFIEYLLARQFNTPIELPSPNNPQKMFEFRVVPFQDNNLMLLVRDVTRLTQIEKMRKDFVANVSHELRTPLTVINGYLEMLPDAAELPPLMVNKAIGEMRTQSLRMQNLIEELLQLSRIEASTERVFDKVVDVPQLLWQIQKEAQTLNREKHHKLFFDIAPQLKVYGIETELRSAFSNLIFNAIHYTPDKGVIEVKWQLNKDAARFSVKDNGDGIASKDITRITERFYRVDKARSRKTGGSGLGLSIVKHVLTHHNSSLKISSAVGVGSDFSCEFLPELTYLPDSHNTAQ